MVWRGHSKERLDQLLVSEAWPCVAPQVRTSPGYVGLVMDSCEYLPKPPHVCGFVAGTIGFTDNDYLF